MNNTRGPWDEDPQAAAQVRATRRRAGPPRLVWWLLLMAAVGGLVLMLFRVFPGVVRTSAERSDLAFALGCLLLVSMRLLAPSRTPLLQHLRHAAIWIGVIGVLGLGYLYRDELAQAPQRIAMAFGAGEALRTGDHELTVPQNGDGEWVVWGEVNGQRVRFVVDSGSTETVLSPDDARRVGAPMGALKYLKSSETANGTGYGAPWTVESLTIGPIELREFGVEVNQAPLSVSLLGQSFLKRMSSVEVRGGKTLVLRWKD